MNGVVIFRSDVAIRELAEMIRRIVGFRGEIVWDTSKPDGTPRKLLDSSRLFALGWRPQVNLEAGIRRVYEHFATVTAPGEIPHNLRAAQPATLISP